ncbi:Para-aminobenzoate synthase, aminase component / Aminodeoxychorismate lyase [hydrothermal vent metagenome]|uniref:Para-aminobenzoate synthase, aminase component / Aminodeoxychorismate lyase n=1 Tax=hydrothermal vent metagenome TaxID=652676 RepID=A0A3B0V2H7_9ZZZZ
MRPLPDNLLNNILDFLRREEDFVFLETSKVSEENYTSLIFSRPLKYISYSAGTQGPADFFAELENYRRRGYFLAGQLDYEFGLELEPALRGLGRQIEEGKILASFGVFEAPITYDHREGEFNRPLPFADRRQGTRQGFRISNLRPSMTRERFLRALRAIKDYLLSGDTYQVNFTLKYLFDFAGDPDALYRRLRLNQPVAYSAYIKAGDRRLLSFSPELFFRKKGQKCIVKPMKGTMPRGHGLQDDLGLARFLAADGKNRSENVMIVDLLRNDLGRLCEPGSVRTTAMFEVETFSTLHQMTSTVEGTLQRHTGLEELFRALFPCGSVTGAPKIRTMEIINELEGGERGTYTGALGFIAPDGEAVFNVPIRTIALGNGRGEMGIGAGITHDSEPRDEWRETLLKGRFLSNPHPEFQLIETILWQAGDGFWLFDQHLQRLRDSALYFSYPLDLHRLRQRLLAMADNWAALPSNRRLRVLLFRDGSIDITVVECGPPAALSLTGPPAGGGAQQELLPLIEISPQKTDSSNIYLYHKTTMRELYNKERRRAGRDGLYEIIFCNERDEITEGTISNIIIRRQGHFFTPPVDCGLLPGMARRMLIEGRQISEEVLTAADLYDAESIYFVNSVRGLVEVRIATP